MIDSLFNNFRFRLAIAFILCVVLAFASRFDVLSQRTMTVAIFLMLVLMVMSNVDHDYGLVLLVLALFVLSYNMARRNPNEDTTLKNESINV